ncbi:ATPase RavA stimulator ViaA [Candidatus Fukatsuia symbiotica]|uniref:Regulatory protein ViaA n=1 Tax=Candidatus Fukatsuia symbiotica TaxID=1878942 RepID=A0A2Y9CK85_9GAMM|nr:ATPase RavA stimulator ViaA [Candidatus Fukatsuia symbiotica]AWK13241.1 hypothetical protein CCS41_00010 [Candidatus Fukatsuia symbiotica]MEA9444109.1 ATPase RavA stimulator ViaA [Candidatus Fukatsuia symbiotica]
MLSLATLDMLLSISEGTLVEEIVIGVLATPQLATLFAKFPRIKRALTKDIPRWKQNFQQRIQEARVPSNLAEEFFLYQHSQQENSTLFYQHLTAIVDELTTLNSPFLTQAKNIIDASDFEQNPPSGESLQCLFLQRWRLSLTLQTLNIHHTLLEQEKEKLLAELQQRLALSGALEPLLADNDTAAGRLWDMSHGQLQQNDYQLLQQYTDFLQQQTELQQIAEQLGRSKTAKTQPNAETHVGSYTLMVRQPDTFPEEVSGIQQSNDILRLLPTELMLLGINELEFEFYRRLLERRLLTYRLQGDHWQKQQWQRTVNQQGGEQQPRGPFIVCVDTSGSMGQFSEQCAKAFCLALLRIALADSRRCYVMLFATEVVHYELSADNGIEQAIRFLGQRFRGGTDLAACLANTLAKMEEQQWIDTDAIIISDFIAQRLPQDLIKKIKTQQQIHQHRFHAIAMSSYGKPGIMQIFDHIWRFDNGLKSRLLRRWRH